MWKNTLLSASVMLVMIAFCVTGVVGQDDQRQDSQEVIVQQQVTQESNSQEQRSSIRHRVRVEIDQDDVDGHEGEFRFEFAPQVVEFRLRQHDHDVEIDGHAESYWLGVDCIPAPVSLQVQLRFEHGLVVDSIAPDSPASRAGLQPHDVILNFEGKELAEVDELVEMIQDQKDQEANVIVLRHGVMKEIKLTAEPRQPIKSLDAIYTIGTVVADQGDLRPIEATLHDWSAQPILHADHGDMLRMFVVRPGVVVDAEQVEIAREFAVEDGREIRILETVGEPARVVIEHHEESTTITEEDYENIPQDVRQMLINATREFHLRDSPIRVGNEQLRFFPRFNEFERPEGPFDVSLIPRVTTDRIQTIFAENPPLRIHSINVGDEGRVVRLVDPHSMDELDAVRIRRIQMERILTQMESEIEIMRVRLDELSELELQLRSHQSHDSQGVHERETSPGTPIRRRPRPDENEIP